LNSSLKGVVKGNTSSKSCIFRLLDYENIFFKGHFTNYFQRSFGIKAGFGGWASLYFKVVLVFTFAFSTYLVSTSFNSHLTSLQSRPVSPEKKIIIYPLLVHSISARLLKADSLSASTD